MHVGNLQFNERHLYDGVSVEYRILEDEDKATRYIYYTIDI